MSVNISVVQFDPHVGAVESNLKRIESIVRAEAARGSELVVFPECAVTGYPFQDLALLPGFIARVESALDRLAEAVVAIGGPAVIVGAPIAGPRLPYNTAVFLAPDGRRTVIRKAELPNSDVFDEVRNFEVGEPGFPIPWKGFRFGVMVCEDMWHGRVAAHLADELADAYVVINGSPFETGKAEGPRLQHACARARHNGLPLLYVNMVGAQDEIVFDGCSFAVSAEGRLTVRLPAFRETVASVKLSRDDSGRTDYRTCGRDWEHEEVIGAAWPSTLASLWLASVTSLRSYVEKNGFASVLLGLSGGIDSAVTAAMAVDAIGATRVRTVMLPSAVTIKEGTSIELAEAQALRLGCPYDLVDIRPMADAFLAALSPFMESADAKAAAITRQNLQSRIRGTVLMALSNLHGGLLLSTGNKSENSVGYATIYGDMCGGYNPIKDMFKTEVYDVTAWRNALGAAEIEEFGLLGPVQPIDPRIEVRPPTAELEEGQTDEQALGDYDMLDAVLRAMVERLMDPVPAAREASAALGRDVDPAYARRIMGLLRRAEWKRRQAAPGPKLGPRNFGLGWRMPITVSREAF